MSRSSLITGFDKVLRRSLFTLRRLLPCGILKEVGVNLVTWQLDISGVILVMLRTIGENMILHSPDNTPSDEAVLDAEHVGILVWVGHTDVC